MEGKDPCYDMKLNAAMKAVEYIQSGMVVGFGHGSTAILALQRMAALLESGQLRDVLCVPCSKAMEREALKLRVPVVSLEECSEVDLTIDGADEVDPNLDLIKGGGGAFLREKILAQASRREIIIVDETKLSSRLGTRWAVPVEVVSFGWSSQAKYLSSLGAEVTLRTEASGRPVVTDQANLILDSRFSTLDNPVALSLKIKERAGVVEHGLFLGLASEVIVGTRTGVYSLMPPMR